MKFWAKVRFLALFAGAGVDLAGTYFVTFKIMVMLGFTAGISRQDPYQLIASLMKDVPTLICVELIGLAFSFLGAFITSLMARPHSRCNAIVLGSAMTLLGLCFAGGLPWWFDVVAFAGTLPVSLLAALLVERFDAPLPKAGSAA